MFDKSKQADRYVILYFIMLQDIQSQWQDFQEWTGWLIQKWTTVKLEMPVVHILVTLEK